jgi:hypothetical protein
MDSFIHRRPDCRNLLQHSVIRNVSPKALIHDPHGRDAGDDAPKMKVPVAIRNQRDESAAQSTTDAYSDDARGAWVSPQKDIQLPILPGDLCGRVPGDGNTRQRERVLRGLPAQDE